MRGIMLCGGDAKRLGLLTEVTNKHLLPVGDKPMCLHPLDTLVRSGIKDICVVIGGRNIGKFTEFLGDGSQFGANLYYRYQGKPAGISHAISQCRDFVRDEPFAVILGDNIFLGSAFQSTSEAHAKTGGATIVLATSPTPERFAVAVYRDNKIVKIVEKPMEHIGDSIVTGLYFFDHKFFDYFNRTEPSARGEYENCDIINQYIEAGNLRSVMYDGKWMDAGTLSSLKQANLDCWGD